MLDHRVEFRGFSGRIDAIRGSAGDKVTIQRRGRTKFPSHMPVILGRAESARDEGGLIPIVLVSLLIAEDVRNVAARAVNFRLSDGLLRQDFKLLVPPVRVFPAKPGPMHGIGIDGLGPNREKGDDVTVFLAEVAVTPGPNRSDAVTSEVTENLARGASGIGGRQDLREGDGCTSPPRDIPAVEGERHQQRHRAQPGSRHSGHRSGYAS